MDKKKANHDTGVDETEPHRIAAELTRAQDEAAGILIAAQDRAVAVLLEAQDRAAALVLSAATRASVTPEADEEERRQIYLKAADQLLKDQKAAGAALLKSQREAAAKLLHAHMVIQDKLNAAKKPRG